MFDKPQTVMRGSRINLEIMHSSHQDRWVDVRSQSREFIAPWEPKWDDFSDKPYAFRARLKLHQEEWRHKRGLGLLLIAQHLPHKPVVGGINLSNIRYGVNLSCNLGYWTGKAHTRQGYMFEGLNLCIDFCFNTLQLRRLQAATLLHNEASQKLLIKLGFTPEGIAREMLCIDGAWQDHRCFSLLLNDQRQFRA